MCLSSELRPPGPSSQSRPSATLSYHLRNRFVYPLTEVLRVTDRTQGPQSSARRRSTRQAHSLAGPSRQAASSSPTTWRLSAPPTASLQSCARPVHRRSRVAASARAAAAAAAGQQSCVHSSYCPGRVLLPLLPPPPTLPYPHVPSLALMPMRMPHSFSDVSSPQQAGPLAREGADPGAGTHRSQGGGCN